MPPPLTEYILNKTGWTRQTFETVDWQSIKIAFNTKTENQKVNLCKFIHRWRPTMERLHKIDPKNYPTAMCNICKTNIETQNHIYRCAHHASRNIQTLAIKKIETKAIAGGYNKYLIYCLLKGLHAWIHNQPPPRLSRKTNKVHVLVKKAMEK